MHAFSTELKKTKAKMTTEKDKMKPLVEYFKA